MQEFRVGEVSGALEERLETSLCTGDHGRIISEQQARSILRNIQRGRSLIVLLD